MPGQNDEVVQGEGDVRYLSLGAMRIHNGHVEAGRTRLKSCRICSEGLEGTVETSKDLGSVDARVEVVESHGGDEERDAALAYGLWGDSAGDDNPVLDRKAEDKEL